MGSLAKIPTKYQRTQNGYGGPKNGSGGTNTNKIPNAVKRGVSFLSYFDINNIKM